MLQECRVLSLFCSLLYPQMLRKMCGTLWTPNKYLLNEDFVYKPSSKEEEEGRPSMWHNSLLIRHIFSVCLPVYRKRWIEISIN